MLGQRYRYEIQVARDGRWVVANVCDDQEMAEGFARKVLNQPNTEAVRIVRDWRRIDGRHVEKVVFEEKAGPRKEAPIQVAAIESAPYCRATNDYFGLNSRLTINRLFRGYLDKQILTPTELLHNHKEWRRISGADALVSTAVDRVATLQTRDTGEDSRARRDDMYKALDEIGAKARDAARRTDLPDLKKSGFGRAFDRLTRLASDQEERDYLARVVLSNHLVDQRTWPGKLHGALGMVDPGFEPAANAVLDGVVADILGAPSVVQDLLGWQPNLATALCRLTDLREGVFEPQPGADGNLSLRLNTLIGNGTLPSSQDAIMDRIRRQIASAQPLDRNNPRGETEAFRSLLKRLFLPDGFIGGPETAEALTQRMCRMVERGGAPGRSDAIDVILDTLSDGRERIVYLAQLAGTDFGRQQIEDIRARLDTLIRQAPSIDRIVAPSLAPKEKMALITGLYRLVQNSGLPSADRAGAAAGLDDLLARYLVEQKIIERLDNPNDALRNRAIRLVQFCASGLLTEGKALALAQNHVVSHIRRPNFDQFFVADLPAAEHEKAIRGFFTLLRKAGFG